MCTKTTYLQLLSSDDIVNEVEIFFEGLDNSILCTIEKTEKQQVIINRGKNIEEWILSGMRTN
jgi:hypothetical protein